MTSPNLTLAVVIPAYNEAAIIQHTLNHLTTHISPRHIYLVDDHSTDNTTRLARVYTKNILRRRKNHGKGAALNAAIAKWRLTQSYDLIMPLDADTIVTPTFFPAIIQRFTKDTHHHLACVSGQVRTRPDNWLTGYRAWEYEIGQSIHKTAQSYIKGIIVCPGCATVYRASVFRTLKFSTHSLAEDMDLTFAIHRHHLGQIAYEAKAIIITQDPKKLGDFLRQIDRWYTGLWQCIVKYNVPWEGQRLDLEVALMATEGLFSGLVLGLILLLAPYSFSLNPGLILFPLLIDIGLFLTPTIIYANLRQRQAPLVRYLLHFYFLRAVSSFVFIAAFFKVMVNKETTMKWFSPQRYYLGKM